MIKKITYLLGAGASANTIPIVSQMNARIAKIQTLLKGFSTGMNPQNSPQELHINHSILNSWQLDLKWLLDEVGLYFSLDTLARKYYLTANFRNLERLKWCIVLYFTIEQLLYLHSDKMDEFEKKIIDNRYDSFFATIGQIRPDKSVELNTNIKILSWNYDVQIELSLKRFFNELSLINIKDAFHIHPNKNSVDAMEKQIFDSNKFGVVKLNGNAIWTRNIDENDISIFDSSLNDERSYTKKVKDFNYREGIAYLVNEYSLWKSDTWSDNFIKYFNFAWENKNKDHYSTYKGHDNIIREAERIASETEILVVIGYSFPIFNREIDNRLFKSMNHLEKVYIQDIEPEKIKATIENAFNIRSKGIGDKNIQLNSNINQFVIPYELNQD